MHLLELHRVSKSFGSRHVLAGIDLSIREGEFVSVVGYSGAGKSTLIGLASGLIAPSSGEVRLAGKRLEGFATRAAIVFQNYSLLPWFSALENVRLAVEAAFPDWHPAQQREQAAKYLEMVGLTNAFEKRPSQLSGGMRQRVAIARAFAVEPELLFLDEPFGALDALTRATLQQELQRMSARSGATTLMVTNSLDEATLLSSRIIPLGKGPRAMLGPSIPVSAAEDSLLIQARLIEFLTNTKMTPEPLEATA